MPEGYMCDVYDGQVWKEFMQPRDGFTLSNQRNYAVMLNVDWFQPFKHGVDSVGVVYLTLLNLPRKHRFKRHNVILVGIIPALSSEPSRLTSFLQPLVDELKVLWTEGVLLCSADSPSVPQRHYLALICVACDMPASRKVSGFLGHNANKGCSRCFKTFPGEVGKKDFSGFDRENWQPRLIGAHRRCVLEIESCRTPTAKATEESRMGVRYSALLQLEYFDAIRFTIVDPMHNLFLGTAKSFFKNILIARDVLSKEALSTLKDRVIRMEVPGNLGRLPKKIVSSFTSFTADEWKNWTLGYSSIALTGLLPADDLACWRSFVLACQSFTTPMIKLADVTKADVLLLQFCKRFEARYGKESVTPNMHMHCHLADCVRDFGPIYGFWLFSFERYNGVLGKYPTNNRSTEIQLMRRFIREATILSYNINLPSQLKIFPSISENDETDFNSSNSEHVRSFLYAATCSLLDPREDILSLWSLSDHISMCKWSSIAAFDWEERSYVHNVYRTLYGTDFHCSLEDVPITFHKYSYVTIGQERYGSKCSKQTVRGSVIMASWSTNAGQILRENFFLRPGMVLFYAKHTVHVEGHALVHCLACVKWFEQPAVHVLSSPPVSFWKSHAFVTGGPATFIPVQRIYCKCTALEINWNNEDVLAVCPLPRKEYI